MNTRSMRVKTFHKEVNIHHQTTRQVAYITRNFILVCLFVNFCWFAALKNSSSKGCRQKFGKRSSVRSITGRPSSGFETALPTLHRNWAHSVSNGSSATIHWISWKDTFFSALWQMDMISAIFFLRIFGNIVISCHIRRWITPCAGGVAKVTFVASRRNVTSGFD